MYVLNLLTRQQTDNFGPRGKSDEEILDNGDPSPSLGGVVVEERAHVQSALGRRPHERAGHRLLDLVQPRLVPRVSSQ